MDYSIITCTRNEEKYIRHTLESVINQSVLPKIWIIVNDDSTDSTPKIVKEYEERYTWIKMINANSLAENIKSTGGRVAALFNYALGKYNIDSEYIIKMDSDISFDIKFIESLYYEFIKDKNLGVASGTLVDNGVVEKIDYSGSVTRGAVMVIRKCILEKTKGLFVSKGNGEDTLLSVSARYFGYKTKSFPIYFNHLKPEGINSHILGRHWITGYYKGSIPYYTTYFLLTQAHHYKSRPFIIGSLFQICGYLTSKYIKRYRPFPKYVTEQLHKEQKIFIQSLKNKL